MEHTIQALIIRLMLHYFDLMAIANAQVHFKNVILLPHASNSVYVHSTLQMKRIAIEQRTHSCMRLNA